ncbi:hypothetical protein VRZ77_11065 [Ancylobacter sp. G4_0304]
MNQQALHRANARWLEATLEANRSPAEASGTRASRWILGAAGVLVLAAAIGLWARHGAAVFFDLVSAGIAYCF